MPEIEIWQRNVCSIKVILYRVDDLLDVSTGIVLEAYSPLGNPTRPTIKKEGPVLLDDPVLKEIADKHSVTPAQVGVNQSMITFYLSLQ